jgi:hypothetical protein
MSGGRITPIGSRETELVELHGTGECRIVGTGSQDEEVDRQVAGSCMDAGW